jgi:hypothetical protein
MGYKRVSCEINRSIWVTNAEQIKSYRFCTSSRSYWNSYTTQNIISSVLLTRFTTRCSPRIYNCSPIIPWLICLKVHKNFVTYIMSSLFAGNCKAHWPMFRCRNNWEVIEAMWAFRYGLLYRCQEIDVFPLLLTFTCDVKFSQQCW